MIEMQQPVSKACFCHFRFELNRRKMDRFRSQAKRTPVYDEQMLCLKLLKALDGLFGIEVRHKPWGTMGIATQVDYCQINGKFIADFPKAAKIRGIAGNKNSWARSRFDKKGSA